MRTADLPTAGAYADAGLAAPGGQSLMGIPITVYPSVPAGGKHFSDCVLVVWVSWGVGYGSAQMISAPFLAPAGYVLVITCWRARYVRSNASGSVYPYGPIVAELRKNDTPDLGTVGEGSAASNTPHQGVQFWLFDGHAPLHMVLWGEDTAEAVLSVDTLSMTPVEVAGLDILVEVEGVYLTPNNLPPEYTELAVGEVRAR
jgi:hypothetical protein